MAVKYINLFTTKDDNLTLQMSKNMIDKSLNNNLTIIASVNSKQLKCNDPYISRTGLLRPTETCPSLVQAT